MTRIANTRGARVSQRAACAAGGGDAGPHPRGDRRGSWRAASPAVSIPAVAREAGRIGPDGLPPLRHEAGAPGGGLSARRAARRARTSRHPRSIDELRDGVATVLRRASTRSTTLARAAMASPASDEVRRASMPARLGHDRAPGRSVEPTAGEGRSRSDRASAGGPASVIGAADVARPPRRLGRGGGRRHRLDRACGHRPPAGGGTDERRRRSDGCSDVAHGRCRRGRRQGRQPRRADRRGRPRPGWRGADGAGRGSCPRTSAGRCCAAASASWAPARSPCARAASPRTAPSAPTPACTSRCSTSRPAGLAEAADRCLASAQRRAASPATRRPATAGRPHGGDRPAHGRRRRSGRGADRRSDHRRPRARRVVTAVRGTRRSAGLRRGRRRRMGRQPTASPHAAPPARAAIDARQAIAGRERGRRIADARGPPRTSSGRSTPTARSGSSRPGR